MTEINVTQAGYEDGYNAAILGKCCAPSMEDAQIHPSKEHISYYLQGFSSGVTDAKADISA